MEPPTALEPAPISEEKNKVFAACCRSRRATSFAANTPATAARKVVDPESDTETFIALKCSIDNWRWAGVPFTCAPANVSPKGRGSSPSHFASRRRACSRRLRSERQRPDHLTFDLADAAKMSLSFYGKRPGRACGSTSRVCSSRCMRRVSSRRARGLRAIDPRCNEGRSHSVHDRRGHRAALGSVDSSIESTAAGTSLCAGLLGPECHSSTRRPERWRLPFERVWRDPNRVGS